MMRHGWSTRFDRLPISLWAWAIAPVFFMLGCNTTGPAAGTQPLTSSPSSGGQNDPAGDETGLADEDGAVFAGITHVDEARNHPPTASAGQDMTVGAGELVGLDGSDSSDPDGDRLTYGWEQTGGAAAVVLQAANEALAFFSAPHVTVPESLAFTLTVSDGYFTASDTVTVVVVPADAAHPASAGVEIVASPTTGEVPLLVAFAAASTGTGALPAGVYRWDFGDSSTAVGRSTSHLYTQPGYYRVELCIVDSDGSAGDLPCVFKVILATGDSVDDGGLEDLTPNQPPVAVAGVDIPNPTANTLVTLDGTGSFDPDGGPAALSFWWTQTTGTPVTDDPPFDSTAARPRFIAPGYTGDPQWDELRFSLLGYDGADYSAPAPVLVAVSPCLGGPDSDGDGLLDCDDGCPSDPDKTEPGACSCGFSDEDGDGDGSPDCLNPVAYGDAYYVLPDRQKFIGLRALDKTVDGEVPYLLDESKLTYTIVSPPAHGAVRPTLPHTTLVQSLPSLLYVPQSGYTGGDAFTFRVTNEAGHASNVATVSLNVGAWEPPIGIPDPGFGVWESNLMYAAETFNFRPQQVLQVAASADDARWLPAIPSWYHQGTALPLIGISAESESEVFLRFPVRVPPGATVKRASLRFVQSGGSFDASAGDQPTLIHLLNTPDMPSLATDRSGWATLGGPVPWAIEIQWLPGIGKEFYTPAITELVQAYVDLPGRQVGDYIGLKITRDFDAVGPGFPWQRINVSAWDSAGGPHAPMLFIEYEEGGVDHRQPYRDAGGGPYSHYVDFNDPGAEDVDADGIFNFGSPAAPRRTLPPFLPPGAVVEVHGTTERTSEPLYITGLVHTNGLDIGGTPDRPVIVRGAAWNAKPEFRRPLEVRSHYTILENLYFTVEQPTPLAIHLRNTRIVDHNPPVNSGTLTFHHVAVRHSAFRPPEDTGSNGHINTFVGFKCWRDDALPRIHHQVVYDNHLLDNGDWTWPTGGVDYGCIGVLANAEDVWLLDNHLHHVEGDALAIIYEHVDQAPSQVPPQRVYIGRNHVHHCRENHIDGKRPQRLIVAQNKLHTVMALGPEGSSNPSAINIGTGIGSLDVVGAADDVWVLFNEVYDVGNAYIHSAAETVEFPELEARSYVIGNVVHDTWAGPRNYGFIFILGSHVAGWMVNNTAYRCLREIRIGSTPSEAVTGYLRNNLIAEKTTAGASHVAFTQAGFAGALDHNLYGLHPVWSPELAVLIGPTLYTSLPALQAAGWETGSLVGDAGLLDPLRGDFRLHPDSPAVDAGAADEVYDLFMDRFGLDIRFDFLGRPRPYGAAWDIGALEWVP